MPPSMQPQTPMKAEGVYDPMTNPYFNPAAAASTHNHAGSLMTVHEYEAAASIQRQYPTYAVPEIQPEMPWDIASQEAPGAGWRNSQASSVDGNLRNNSIFAPIPRPPGTPISHSESARTTSNRSPQGTTFSQNSGRPLQSVLPDSATTSSAGPAASWFERGVPPSRAALSPPPRGGTAATSTSSVPPQYSEHWAQWQHVGSSALQEKK